MTILGLVVLSFVFAGVGSYINSSSDIAAADVNGDEVSAAALERAYQNERSRMESQFGEAFATLASDATYLQQFRQGILDRLIGEKLIDQTAQELGLRVSDEQIKKAIVGMQEFQVGGEFNNDRYLALLRQAGYQPNEFRDSMRTDMTRRQVSSALLGTEFILASEAEKAFKLQQQTRDARYAIVPATSFVAQADITDDQVNEYYQSNISQFDTEEKVSLSYVELTLSDLMPNVEVTETEVAEYYQQNLQDFRSIEERRVSHILFDSVDESEDVLQQAQDILQRVQSGEDFAELAKAISSDTFSAENGGDLDWFARGSMDPAFEEEAYLLSNIGDVSGVVKSDFGYHIIKLTDIKPEQITPFEEVRVEILDKVKTERAAEEFYTIQERMAEVAFEVPDNLEEVAAVANKPVIQTALFPRNQPPQVVTNGKVLAAAFSSELIEEALNSEVIELEENHVMVVRVSQHEAERTKGLEDVSQEIKQLLVQQSSQEAAKTWADEVQSSLSKAEDITLSLQGMGIEWQVQAAVARSGASIEQNIVEELFKLDDASDKNSGVVALLNGDVAIVQLTKVNEAGVADANQLASLQRRLTSTKAQFLYGDFIESLKAKADITVY
jgi:peptidyl-prolyl cis-trans isomerase D